MIALLDSRECLFDCLVSCTVRHAACSAVSCFVQDCLHRLRVCCLTGTTPAEGATGVAQQRRRTAASPAPSINTIGEVLDMLLGGTGIFAALEQWLIDSDRGEAQVQIDTEMMVPKQQMSSLSATQHSALSYMHDKELFTEEAWSILQLRYIELVFPSDAARRPQGSLLNAA